MNFRGHHSTDPLPAYPCPCAFSLPSALHRLHSVHSGDRPPRRRSPSSSSGYPSRSLTIRPRPGRLPATPSVPESGTVEGNTQTVLPSIPLKTKRNQIPLPPTPRGCPAGSPGCQRVSNKCSSGSRLPRMKATRWTSRQRTFQDTGPHAVPRTGLFRSGKLGVYAFREESRRVCMERIQHPRDVFEVF
jgi:hypothetical protein